MRPEVKNQRWPRHDLDYYILSKLEQRWGSDNFNSYLRRADVQRFRKQLDQLSAG